jgi:MHS family proline/betaine transporter-like MFS transporter
MIYTAFGILLCSPFLYVSSSVDALPRMLVFQTIAVFLITFHFSLLPKALAELFPTTLRYTCVALSYNISNMFVGGSAPAIALYLIQKTTNSAMPALIMVGAALASLLAIHFQKHRSSL